MNPVEYIFVYKKKEHVLLNIYRIKLCMSPVHYLTITDYTIFLAFTLICIKRAKNIINSTKFICYVFTVFTEKWQIFVIIIWKRTVK
jgi:hypothetical protein